MTANECEALIRATIDSMSGINWAAWIQSVLTLLAILVALFGKELISWLKRPELKLDFSIKDDRFFRKVPFQLFKHGEHNHYSKGFLCLLMISNLNKRRWFLQTETAKEVEVKVTYIFEGEKKHTYNPTNLNWSGCMGGEPVQIISGAHHFIDFIRFYNYETELWIDDPNALDGLKKSEILPNQAPAPLPDNKIYFEPLLVGQRNDLD